jgi:predicted regulator of Ras-like GTPase activity (Roadblock/LC7/MglB family)
VAFRLILHELLATTTGAFAAIFLDWEGETVDLVCDRDLSDHDLRVIGAYQAVVLSRLRAMSDKLQLGTPHRYTLNFGSTLVMASDLKDGYYVVLLLDTKANEGMAWHKLDMCRDKLLREM